MERIFLEDVPVVTRVEVGRAADPQGPLILTLWSGPDGATVAMSRRDALTLAEKLREIAEKMPLPRDEN